MKVESESEVAQSCLTLSDPMNRSYQAPPSMGFSRQEYWNGVPLPSPKIVLRVKDVNQQEFLPTAGGSGTGTTNWENFLVFCCGT